MVCFKYPEKPHPTPYSYLAHTHTHTHTHTHIHMPADPPTHQTHNQTQAGQQTSPLEKFTQKDSLINMRHCYTSIIMLIPLPFHLCCCCRDAEHILLSDGKPLCMRSSTHKRSNTPTQHYMPYS